MGLSQQESFRRHTISDLDRRVGKVASAVCSTILARLRRQADCLVVLPAVTFKVKSALAHVSNPRDIPMEGMFTVTQVIRAGVIAALQIYEIDPEKEPGLADEIETAARHALEQPLDT